MFSNEEYSNLAEMYHDFANFYFDNNNWVVEVGEDGLSIRFDGTIVRDTSTTVFALAYPYPDACMCPNAAFQDDQAWTLILGHAV